MAITIYECGDLASVILSPKTVTTSVTLTSNSVTGVVNLGGSTLRVPVEFLCSGRLQIDYTAGTLDTAMVNVSLPGVWTDNFLMGLAGIICGFLIAYVISKYAV